MAEYNVNLMWDEEAFVWVATSDDIPGLVMESGSLDALIERVRNVAPELLQFNNRIKAQAFSISFKALRLEQINL